MLPQTQETIFKSLHALFVKESVVPLSALISPPQSLQHREWHNDKKRERETVRLLAGVQAIWTDAGGCEEPSHL